MWTYLGKERVSPCVIKFRILRWDHPGLSGWALSPRTSEWVRGEDTNGRGKTGEVDVKTEAETGGTCLWANDCQQPPEAKRRESWDRFILRAYRKNWPQQHFDLGCVTSRAEREYVSVVWKHLMCGNLLQQLEKLMHQIVTIRKEDLPYF